MDKISRPINEYRRLLEHNDLFQQALRLSAIDPTTALCRDLTKAIEGPSALTELALGRTPELRLVSEQLAQHQKMVGLASGPMEELRKAGLLDAATGLSWDVLHIKELVAGKNQRFRLPAGLEASALFGGVHASDITRLMDQLQPSRLVVKQAMEAMQSPWLDMHDVGRSAAAFAELQGIGQVLSHLPAFDVRVAKALRSDLGDWRDVIEWPASVFADTVARTTFYSERGLRSDLTDFPAIAFDESISIAGLGETPSPPAGEYGSQVEIDDDDEAGLDRTNAAHGRLLRFEKRFRSFIDQRMTAACGKDWIKQRIPGPMRDAWVERRRKATQEGQQEFALIAYADFTDYTQIITRGDNWKEVFESTFRRPENIRESFQRLYPIRICTMHARIITLDDELFLSAETTRIIRAITTN